MNYAKQAQSVLQTTISAVRVAQKMKDNPAVALTQRYDIRKVEESYKTYTPQGFLRVS